MSAKRTSRLAGFGGPRRSRGAGRHGLDTGDRAHPFAVPPARAGGARWVVAARTRLAGAMTRTRDRRALEAAVPEALDVLRATVSAGASPTNGLAAAAEAVTGPLAIVLDGAVRACGLGIPAGTALADAGRTANLLELVTAGEALDLAAATGAPPGQVLAGVASAAAARARAREARLAATAGARLSVRVLAGLGPGFLLLLSFTSPRDVAFLVNDPAGWATIALAAAFEATGLLWARRILREAP